MRFITPDLLARVDYGYFAVNDEDEYAFLTSEVFRLQSAPPADLAVIVIGSSNTREAITDIQSLETAIESNAGQAVTAIDLSAGGLRTWEAINIAGALRDRIHGVVVLPVSPLAFSLDVSSLETLVEQPRLALNTPVYIETLAAFHAGSVRQTGNYFLDHYGFFLARSRAIVNAFKGPQPVERHFAESWRNPTPEEWQSGIERHRETWSHFNANKDLNLDSYRRLIRYLKQNPAIKVALLEATRNPATDAEVFDTPAMQELYRTYQQTVQQLVAEEHVPYWDLCEAAGVVAGDFVDTAHIKDPAARERYTSLLADRVTLLIEESAAQQEKTP